MNMNFQGRAGLLLGRGIPLIPVTSVGKCKAPLTLNGVKDATLSVDVIRSWAHAHPNANTGAAATPDGFWFLDIDDPAFLDRLLVETGQEALPRTFTVLSSRGRHLYFTQNDASRANGNIKLPGADIQSDGKYVIGPGSVHETGTRYRVADDSPIIEAPAWLTDWLARARPQKSAGAGLTDLAPDAKRVQETIEYLKPRLNAAHMEVLGTAPHLTGGLRVYVPCANKDAHTTDSGPTESAILILPNGAISYVCQHNHCAGIDWAEFSRRYELDQALTSETLARAGFQVLPDPEPAVEPAPAPRENWSFPTHVLYGPLGEMARAVGTPLGLAYPAVLTAFAGRGVPDGRVEGEPLPVRTTLFTALLSGVGGGKSASMDRAVAGVEVLADHNTPSSDRGLAQQVSGRNGGDHLLVQDEFLTLFGKAGMQGSTLLPLLNQLWSQNKGGATDKKISDAIDVRLSMMGGVPLPERHAFRRVFSAETASGFYDRMLFGCPNKGERCPRQLPEIMLRPPAAVGVRVPARLSKRAAEWEERAPAEDVTEYTRMSNLLMRVAVITASASGERELTDGAYTAAEALMDWQRKIRAYYKPGSATDKGGMICEWVLDKLGEYQGSYVHGSLLRLRAHQALGYGSSDIGRELHAMVTGNLLIRNEMTDQYMLAVRR